MALFSIRVRLDPSVAVSKTFFPLLSGQVPVNFGRTSTHHRRVPTRKPGQFCRGSPDRSHPITKVGIANSQKRGWHESVLAPRRARSHAGRRGENGTGWITLKKGGHGAMARKIQPLHDRILVKRLEEKETKKGGLILPDPGKETPQGPRRAPRQAARRARHY